MKNTGSPEISIIVPTYNEHDNIVPLVQRIHQSLQGHSFEIVFVDDNSRDGTADLIRNMSAPCPIRLMVRTDKRGLGSAVVDGIGLAGAPVIAVMDADLQHPPEVLPALFRAVQDGVDIAIASRYVAGGGCEGWSLLRRVISKGAVILAHILLPAVRRVNDPMSGFFMFRRRSIDVNKLKPTGFKILLEMLVVGGARKTAEVPYIFQTRTKGESKLSSRQQIDYLKHLASLFYRSRELWRFVKFCLVGLSGVGVNLGILWLLVEKAVLDEVLSSAIAIEISIITNFLLNNYFTFRDKRQTGSFFPRLVKFNIVSLAGAAINLGLFWFFTSALDVYYILAQVFGIIVATLWNYFLNTIWTWR
jgi:dolichol-phosphate mannosyltransferase